jgi:hypothetical protein
VELLSKNQLAALKRHSERLTNHQKSVTYAGAAMQASAAPAAMRRR